MRRQPDLEGAGYGRWPSATDLRGGDQGGRLWAPPTDIIVAGGTVLIRMELAGVGPEAIDLVADGRVLIIRGTRARQCPPGGCEFSLVEINHGPFQRSFEFPFPLADARLEATCRDGFLTIEVEPASLEPRRIEIAERD